MIPRGPGKRETGSEVFSVSSIPHTIRATCDRRYELYRELKSETTNLLGSGVLVHELGLEGLGDLAVDGGGLLG